MAVNSDYDFVGGYEHDTQAGVLHVANHHVSPGKKQWTWGHGDFGQAWDRNLTDEDGPYIELMTGVFTDNQPDFSWLMPYEEKSFTQYFMPYRELGVVKNATKDVLVNVEKVNGELQVKVFATSVQELNIQILKDGQVLLKAGFRGSPEAVYERTIAVAEDITADNILLVLTNHSGIELLRYENKANKQNDIPEPAKAAPAPEEVANNEQLFLTGQHLEQYRHATYSPVPYYEEALLRDSNDIRNNNALGVWYFRRGRFAKSEPYFRKAIETLTGRNPNPYDGEPYYNLGLCLKMQGRLQEAYNAFYKATWSSAWQDSSFFSVAQIDMALGHYEQALEHVQHAIDRNAKNSKAITLKVVALRKLGLYQTALKVCATALEYDCFNLSVLFEQHQLFTALGDTVAAKRSLAQLIQLARGHANNYIEYALDYAAAGLYQEAIELLELAIKECAVTSPMLWYYLGWANHHCGQAEQALAFFKQGAQADPSGCFPNKLEDIAVLQMTSKLNATDAKAAYYLGNLWYDKRQYDEAIAAWESAVQRDDSFPTVFRNLGIAYFNKRNDAGKALHCYETAYALNTTDARVLMELDQLYKRLNKAPKDRLAFLEEHVSVVEQRDDLYLEKAALYNFLGEYERAYELIMQRKFHPWEGGEGKVSGQYIYSLAEMARQHLQTSQYEKAIALLEQAQVYPPNLGEGKLHGAQENDIFYWLACAYEGMGNKEKATTFLQKATQGLSEPTVAMFYNDQQPDKIFYQGLAWNTLAEKEKASRIFTRLVEYGQAHLQDEVKLDYFAVSLPDLLIFEDDLNVRNQTHCYYMMGLGYLGLNKEQEARDCFKKVQHHDAMHFGARTHLQMVNINGQLAISNRQETPTGQ
jgi:tetratricopeptide (TPR) repeat protein